MAAPRGNERVPGRYSARRTKRQYPRAHWCVWTPRLRNDNASRHSHPGIHPRCRWHRSGRNEAYLNNERSNTMPSTADRVRSVLQGIEERDSDLARELRSVRERTTTLEMPANVEIAEDAGITQRTAPGIRRRGKRGLARTLELRAQSPDPGNSSGREN